MVMLHKVRARVLENILGPVIWSLLVLVISTPPVFAETQSSRRLKIVVKAGEGATNNIKLRLARELMVQVVDENDNPVAQAAVLFTLPDSGAGGAFANSAKTLTVMTNKEGLAVAQGFVPNDIAGSFVIQVDASYQGLTAAATITQSNVVIGTTAVGASGAGAAAGAAGAGAGISAAVLGAIIGGAVVAAVVGVKVATGGGGDSQDSPPRGTISLGPEPILREP